MKDFEEIEIEEAPDECEWSEECDRNPTTDLYEYSDGDEELWVCEEHFIYSAPPKYANIPCH